MTHEQARELLLDLAYGELGPEAATKVARHAAECAACGPELQRLTSTRALASALGEDAPRRSGRAPLVEAARRAVAARPERRWFARSPTASFGAAAAVALVVFGVTLQLTRPGAHRAGDEAREPVSRAARPSVAPRPEAAAPAPAAPSPRTATPRQPAPEPPPRPTVAAEPPAASPPASPPEAAPGQAASREASAAPAAAQPPTADAQRAPAPMRMRRAAKAKAGAAAAASGSRADTGFPQEASFTSNGFVYRAREGGSESGPTLVIEKLRSSGEPVSSWRVEALEGGRALADASGGNFRHLRWSEGVLRFAFHRTERVLACSVSGVGTGAPAVTCAPAAP